MSTSLPFDPERFTVHAQWGPRPRASEDVHRLLAAVLNLCIDLDPRITVWFAEDDRWGLTAAEIREDSKALALLVEDLSGGEPPTLRVVIETSNGAEADAPMTSLDVVLGSTDPFEPNHLTWNLMEAGTRILGSPSYPRALLQSFITATDCDWAAVSSADIDQAQPADPDGPTVGWLTYVSHRRLGRQAPAVAGVTVEPLHRGYVFTAAPKPEAVTAEPISELARNIKDIAINAALSTSTKSHRGPQGRQQPPTLRPTHWPERS